MTYRSRMRQLRATMAKRKIAALLVTHLPDVRYLCGFTGSNAALGITQKAALLVTDGRYTAQAAAEVKVCRGADRQGSGGAGGLPVARGGAREACLLRR